MIIIKTMKYNLEIFMIHKIKWSFMEKVFLGTVLILVMSSFTGFNQTLQAQNSQGIMISGTVVDASTGEFLPGVNVVIQGTFTGAVTDMEGKFTILVPGEESVLNFSFVGYDPVSQRIGTQRALSIAMQPAKTALEEVVFVGYGVQRKESVVGAISQTTGGNNYPGHTG